MLHNPFGNGWRISGRMPRKRLRHRLDLCEVNDCLLSFRSDLMVKKLRYYARFIVVCLLLKKMKLVRDLVMELDKQIADYTSTYEPDDQLEWTLVLEEIKSFIKADGLVSVLHADSNTIVLSHRLSPMTTPPVEKSSMMNLTLQEILIIGNSADQVPFSLLFHASDILYSSQIFFFLFRLSSANSRWTCFGCFRLWSGNPRRISIIFMMLLRLPEEFLS